MSKVKPASYQPDLAVPPGTTILQMLDEKQMSQAELAERMNRPQNKLNEILHGKKAITVETAYQLEKVLGFPANFWMELEKNYQLNSARLAQIKLLEQEATQVPHFPVRDLVKLRFIKRFRDVVQQTKELLSFFAITSFSQLDKPTIQAVAFRKSLGKKASPFSLAAWLRCGELNAQKIETGKFESSKLRAAIPKLRKLSLLPVKDACEQMVSTCAPHGVAIVFVPHLTKSYVCGAAYWLGDKAVIQLTIRFGTDDHFWFSFFHELGHILLHGRKETFLDDFKPDTDDKEREANAFAANTLIPKSEFDRLKASNHRQAEMIRDFASKIGIAPGIVVGRLQHEGLLPFTHMNGLKVKLNWPE